MKEFTEKNLVKLLEVSQPALFKALKNVNFVLRKIEGSSKNVKHYSLENLPDRYKETLKTQGIEVSIETQTIPNAFTKKYLLASKDKQTESVLRCTLVERYNKKSVGTTVSTFLDFLNNDSIEFESLGTITQKKLFDWLKKYKTAKAKGLNVVEELLDSRGVAKGTTSLTIEMQEASIRYFLRTSRVKINAIYLNMCHTFGDSMPSYKTLNKFYNNWKRKNPQLSEFSKSPDSWKNNYQAAFGSLSEKAKYRNHYWELDSTPADIICSDGRRYTVLAAIDVYSRRCIFFVSETSNSYSISQLLRKAILKMGIPENVVIDNGKDYRSIHFESVCTNLGIRMEIVPPFSGDMKPHVERVFRTLSGELFEEMGGYVGHSVAEKSELQSRKSFGNKIISKMKHNKLMSVKTEEEKKAFKDAWKLSKENLGLDLSVTYTAAQLQYWIDSWNTKLYEQRIHSSIKTTPLKKWDDSSLPVQSIPDERMLDLLLGENITRRVGKKGIRFDGAEYQHINLVEQIGQYVYCLVPSDWGQLLVYSENMKFLCIAEDPSKLGCNRYNARAAKKKSVSLSKQFDKVLKEIEEHNDTSILTRIDDSISIEEIKTVAVTKRTETIDMLINDSKEIALQDEEALEKSNKYDFKNKTDEGKPQKILPSGRPLFQSFIKRFVWDLEHDMVDETTKSLAKDNPSMWEMAKQQAKVS